MYQFYYSDNSINPPVAEVKQNIADVFGITAIRPTMWEEHCLECSAPACFSSCVHYLPRSDGRCKRFENGITLFQSESACCGRGARVHFRKWANMMTVLFPAMLSTDDYLKLDNKNIKKGNRLHKLERSKLPRAIRWQGIRIPEFLRRRSLRGLKGLDNTPNAFVLHAYSHNSQSYRLIIEVYSDHTSVFKTSVLMHQGENMAVITGLSPECAKANNVVKIYPENDFQAVIDFYWCDFVQGTPVVAETPAKQVKCLVWDLDNTLWDGVLIETENTDNIKIKPSVESLIKQLDNMGVIQSVASKNDFETAYPVLERLGLAEYFIYPQIHWNAKSGSLKSIAKSLNIGIDSLALVDDSVFEREEVRSALPMVRVYDITEIHSLLTLPEFDLPVTDDSKNRRKMYKAEEQRNILMQAQCDGTLEFLKKCNLQAKLFIPTTHDEITRCFELVVRTNQLNMSGIKYTEDEFKSVISRENHTSFAFSAADNFGSYGIVGFGQYKIENNTLVFTEFAMSCRAAGKYIESALFSHLLSRESVNSGLFKVIKTKKNTLLRNTLQSVGFKISAETDNYITYTFTQNLLNSEIITVS